MENCPDIGVIGVKNCPPCSVQSRVWEPGVHVRRFVIGQQLPVSDDTVMTLTLGIVIEAEKRAVLVLADANGQSYILSTELSDAELAAYRAHPESFFGRVQQVSRQAIDLFEMFEFFVDGHKEMPKERLLELMANAPNAAELEQLEQLEQEELILMYAERLPVHDCCRKKVGIK